jgi:membrane-associated protease RseP (regulator of RpoE activity)
MRAFLSVEGNLMNTFTIIALFIAVWIGIYFILRGFRTERWGLTVKPFYMIYKTTALNRLMERIAGKLRFGWLVAWNIAAASAVGQILFIFYSLVKNAYFFFQRPEHAAQVTVLVPGLTVSPESLPYMLVSLVVVVLTHEFAHGVASLAEKIPLKSSGVFLALVLPGAFVEIDEEKLEEARLPTKLRIFSAGASTNIAAGMLVLLLMANFTLTISPLYVPQSSGVLITGLVEGGAAEKAGIKKWDTIFALNGTPVKGVNELRDYMAKVKPNSILTVTTGHNELTIKTQASTESPARALIGIMPFDYYPPRNASLPGELPYQVFLTENWMNMILVSVALLNMLPIGPLDGGKFTDTILKLIKAKRAKEIGIAITVLCAVILGLNIVLSFLRFGFSRI